MTEAKAEQPQVAPAPVPEAHIPLEDGFFPPGLRVEAQSFSSQELLTLTSALKLAAKIYEPRSRSNLSDTPFVPLMPHAVDLAVHLIAQGAPLHTVIAGLFYDADRGAVRGPIDALAATIDRKFGSVAPEGKISIHLKLSNETNPRTGPGPVAVEDVGEVARTLLSKVDPNTLRPTSYSADDLRFMSRAVWSSYNLMLDTKARPWGPNEQLSMFRHAAEVGLLLLGAQQPPTVVAAGLMHDFYEGYVEVPSIEEIETFVQERFGREVHELLTVVTEPPKKPTHKNWWERKLAVVRSLEELEAAPNTVVCAAKISTITEGNKFLYEGGALQGWTAGSWADNLAVFEMLRQLFDEKGVPKTLLERFDIELERWRSNNPANTPQ